MANERIMPRTLTSQRLGNTDQYQIVSARSLPQREKLISDLTEPSFPALVHSIPSTSDKPIAIPLHCTHSDSILVADRYRCKHCYKILQNISTVSAITMLTQDSLAVRHEVSHSSANLVPANGMELKPSHKVLNW